MTESTTVLDPLVYQDQSWCKKCRMEQTFVAVFEFAGGRLGYFLGCGHEDVIPFTRTNSEAA